MRRLVWAFAGRTYHIVGNLMSRLIIDLCLILYCILHCLISNCLTDIILHLLNTCTTIPCLPISLMHSRRWKAGSSCCFVKAWLYLTFIEVMCGLSKSPWKPLLTLCISETLEQVLLQTVKTQMECSIMLHFIRVYTVCQGKKDLQPKEYNIFWKL